MTFDRIAIVLLIFLTGHVSAGDHWSYKNFQKWPGVCGTGKLQSPIDLSEKVATGKAFTPMQFENYDKVYTAKMQNNKHSVELRLLYGDKQPSIQGANLPGKFMLDSIHFHWASEHTVNDRRYPLEMHLVHYDENLGNLSQAVKFKGGIAVLGVLFNLSPDDDSDLEQMIELIENIDKFPEKFVELKERIEPGAFLPCDTAGFYRYEGSLTTPQCSEVVIWTVFTNAQTLSQTQVKYFEQIVGDEGPLTTNYRPVQKLNGRKVFLKKSPIVSASTVSTVTPLTLIAVFITTTFL